MANVSGTPERLPHPDIVAAHLTVQYLGLDGPIEYDAGAGILSLNSGTERLEGTPAEVLLHPNFYAPQVQTEAERLNLALEIGFLLGGKRNG